MCMRHRKTFLLPDLPAHQRYGIAEGRLRFVIPGRLPDGQLSSTSVLMRQQRHQGKETQQGRRGAQDCQVRPLPLGLHTQVLADFVIGHFNGLITNDKFCLSRPGRLSLSWSRRPRRLLRADAKADYPPNDIGHCGGTYETPMARMPATDSHPRWAASMGSS